MKTRTLLFAATGRFLVLGAAYALLALAGAALANTETVGGYVWTYSVWGTQTEEGGYDWTDAEIEDVSPRPEGEVEVPARLGVWPVSYLKASLFKDCTNLTAVTLPETVTNVRSSAFSGCTSLARVRMLAPRVRLGTKAFANCPAVEFAEIPGRSAFSTVFPDSVTNLREVVVVDGSTSLAKNAFKGCTSLTSVTLPPTVTSVGSGAFQGCTSLADLSLPASVVSIGSSAFKGCLSLVRIQMLAPKISVGSGAFSACSNIVSVVMPGAPRLSTVFPSSYGTIRDASVTEGSGKLANDYFRGCTNLVSVSLPSSLTVIGSAAFANCASLESLVLPKSLERIKKNVFKGCAALTSLTVLGDCPSDEPKLTDTAEGLVVRVPSSSAGWTDVEDMWGGRPVEFYVDSSVPYALPPLDSSRITDGIVASRTFSTAGCVMDGSGSVSAVVEVRIGRAGRQGSKVSAAMTGLDGGKVAFTPVSADLASGPAELVLRKKGKGALRIVLGRNKAGVSMFTGWWGTGIVRSAAVGGARTASAAFALSEDFPRELPKGVVAADFLPVNEPVKMEGSRWRLAGAANVAYVKDRETGEYDWRINGGKSDSPRTNLSGLRLLYAPKTGAFQGSFRVYSLKDHFLAKTGVKVTGVVVGGVGYGLATIKYVGSWPVRIE